MIRGTVGWRGEVLSQLRRVIMEAAPELDEQVKWRKPSNPAGVPVWSYNGIVCFGNVLKNAVRLTFPKGARLKDTKKVFNTRRDSEKVRAVDFHEGEAVNKNALKALIIEAVKLNLAKS